MATAWRSMNDILGIVEEEQVRVAAHFAPLRIDRRLPDRPGTEIPVSDWKRPDEPRNVAIVRLARSGYTHIVIGSLFELSPGRISQIVRAQKG